MNRILFLLALLLLLTACATARPPSGIAMGDGLHLVLPPVSVFDRPVDATQLVTARYGGQTFVFQDRIMIRPGHVRIAAFDLLGRTVVTIDWTAQGIKTWQAPWLPPQVRPDNILADFIVTNAPARATEQAIASSGVRLIERPNQRSLWRGGRALIRLEYQGGAPDQFTGRVIEQNLAWGYSLDIRSEAAP